MRSFFEFLMSGWTFYFRWPVFRYQNFHPSGVLLGGFYQSLVFLSVVKLIGLFATTPGYQVFGGMVALSAWTGFFHEDGLADTADSLGVSKFSGQSENLERITAAFKDPRLGTFGVSALCLLWLVRYQVAIVVEMPALLVWFAYLVSRKSAILAGVLASRHMPVANSARASHLMLALPGGATWIAAILGFGLALGGLVAGTKGVGFGFWGGWGQLASAWQGMLLPLAWASLPMLALVALGASFIFIGCALSVGLVRILTKRSEALNGDILGAAACCAEVLILLLFIKFI